MSELNGSIVDSFVETVNTGAEEAASAFERTFGEPISIKPGIANELDLNTFRQKVSGKGLVLVLYVGGEGIVIIIPKSTGLVPAWCDNPDATGKSKLSTFAQEWGMNLVPEDFFPEDFKAAVLQDASEGIVRGKLGSSPGFLEVILTRPSNEEGPIPVYMVWPLADPDAVLDEPKAEEPEPVIGPPPTFGNSDLNFIGQTGPTFDPFAGQNFSGSQMKRHSLDDLPGYSRSVLKVRIPVAVVLATARKPIKSILELGVGSVIQFDKSCDDPLEVEVGQSVVIGTAEAVKVGDKFGFRIHSILLPTERFRTVEVRREGEYRVNQRAPQIIGKAPIKSLDQK